MTAPSHPIAQGIPPQLDIPMEEMYGEYFDIPKPDDVVFTGWFAGGEVFRSGCTFQRGLGRIFTSSRDMRNIRFIIYPKSSRFLPMQ